MNTVNFASSSMPGSLDLRFGNYYLMELLTRKVV